MYDDPKQYVFDAVELRFAASHRCRCGARLAYAPDNNFDAWWCSDVLMGIPRDCSIVRRDIISGFNPRAGRHDCFPFRVWDIPEEVSE